MVKGSCHFDSQHQLQVCFEMAFVTPEVFGFVCSFGAMQLEDLECGMDKIPGFLLWI